MASTRRVLVVDDDEDVLQFISTVLAADGNAVTQARTLQEARDSLLAGSFDAVVTDIDLPDGDGVTLIPFVGVTKPVTRVVVVTGHVSYAQAVKSLHAGAYDFLSKPIRRDALLSSVRRAVEAKGLEDENEVLVSRLAGRVSSLQDMLGIAREVSGSLELEKVLSGALDRTLDFLHCEVGAILLRDQAHHLKFAIVRGGPAPETLIGLRLPDETGIAGWVARHRRALVVNDVRRDPRFFPGADEMSGVHTRSVMAIPLLSKGELVGVLEVVNTCQEKFTRDDRIAGETLSFSIAAAIENARVNEALTRSQAMLVDHSHNLEQRVWERTSELRESNERLGEANRRLEETRDQMVRAEKMASIGCIAAGVAHEINNPIGFISSNLQTLKGYLADLKPVIEELRRVAPADPERQKRLDKMDLDFVLGDVETLVRESEDGVKRVVKIVKDLKTFSHVGRQSTAEECDLNACVETAINLARNETKYVADVAMELGDLPRLRAWPSEITQVLLNLVVNAAHAVAPPADAEAGVSQTFGKIVVRSRVDGPWAVLEVTDNGCGIAKDIASRIFDPFFTTKEPGKGTGLGLSLSYEIVQRHHGEISMESEQGAGATFLVRIPLSGATDAVVAPASVVDPAPGNSREWERPGNGTAAAKILQ